LRSLANLVCKLKVTMKLQNWQLNFLWVPNNKTKSLKFTLYTHWKKWRKMLFAIYYLPNFFINKLLFNSINFKVGRQHRYCQADGSWSPRILPECIRKLDLPNTVLLLIYLPHLFVIIYSWVYLTSKNNIIFDLKRSAKVKAQTERQRSVFMCV
jgi:hypothetical protein